jgi:hypothetical protein
MIVWLGKQHLEQRDKVKQAVVRGQGISKAKLENAAQDLDGRLAALFCRAPDNAGEPTKH